MNYSLKELVEIPRLRSLLDSLYDISNIPTAILDAEGNILVTSAWQDICSKFHRINPDTHMQCVESDQHIEASLLGEEPYVLKKCPMGLIDAAIPIVLDGRHLGSIFVGQLFLEPQNEEYFTDQAHKYGFDESEYLSAMRKVPIFTEDPFRAKLVCIGNLTQLIVEQGLDLKRQNDAQEAQRESEERFRLIFDQSLDAIFITVPDGSVINANSAACRMFERTEQELCNLGRGGVVDTTDPRLAAALDERERYGRANAELTCIRRNGDPFPAEVSSVITKSEPQRSFVIIRDISERKVAETLLKTSEEKFNKAFNASPDAISIVSVSDGKYIEVNDCFLDLVGYKKTDIIGHTSTEFNFWVNIDDRKLFLDRLAKEGSLRNVELRFRVKNNEMRDFLVSSEVLDIDGNLCSLNFIKDVTESKQLYDSLSENQLFLSDLIDNSGAVIYAKDCDGNLLFVNKKWEEVAGFRKEFVAGKKESEFFSEIASKQFRDNDIRVMESGTCIETEEILEDENGKRTFLSIKFPMRDHNNKIKGICGMSAEITDRKQIEETLRESEYFFKECQRAAHIGSYTADFENNYWTSSEILDTIFGIDQNYDRSIQGWLDIVHPEDRDMMCRYLREEVIAKKTTFSKEYRIVRNNDSETRWVNGLGEAKFNQNGEVVSLIGTIQDITDRKFADEERLKVEKQLIHAQKLESLGVLAGGIAHDFNNLLAVIIGHCSLAMMKPQLAESHIPQIETAANRAADLCRQMLAYAGKSQSIQSEVNVWELVNEMVKMLRSTITKNVSITSNISRNIPLITADASQIRQIVMNLIINASEAIGEAQGEIGVSLTMNSVKASPVQKDHLGKVIPAGGYLFLEITDDGSGMDEVTSQRIFEPFYTTKFTGRGLGMSAILGIITAHKGALQLFTQPNKGTTFKVYLPIPASESTAAEATEQNAQDSPWQSTGTVLLAEDEVQVSMVAKAMLEALGFTVIEASNGKEALDLYQKHAADIALVVTDVGMPIMDGYELFRQLKILNPYLPIIISSGFGDTVVTSRIAREDIAGLVSKPFSLVQLREVLKSVVESIT